MKKLFSGKKKGSISSVSSGSQNTMRSSSSTNSEGVATPTSSDTNADDTMSISGSTLNSPSQGIATPSQSTVSIADTDVTVSATPSSTDIQLSTFSATLEDSGISRTLISLTPPTTSSRQPITLMCVIDISGSMSTIANIKTNENGVESTENDGLSVLDVVKHAMRTIIASLESSDKLGIVTFSDQARVEMVVTRMDTAGKKKAGEVVEKMRVEGMTNLWDGIKTGLNELAKEKGKTTTENGLKDSVASLFVLTDGCPNVEPPRGSVAMLKTYFDGHEEVRGVGVHTFGFGYSLDSKILSQLAEVGRGSFVFIPDAGMVGTAFINALANTLVTMAVNAVLSIEVEDGVELVSQGKKLKVVDGLSLASWANNTMGNLEEDEWVLGGYESTKTSWGVQLYLGSIQYGQSKDVVLEFTGPGIKEGKPFINLKLTYEICCPTGSKVTSLEGISYPPQPARADAISLISYHYSRLLAVDTLNAILRTNSEASEVWSSQPKLSQHLTTTAIEPIKSSPSSSSQQTKALLADLTGQFTLALSKRDFFNRWGSHYLRSLSRAHLMQICSNFKDPGIQLYGGSTFRSLRQKLDTIFDGLPAPKPSLPQQRSGTRSGGPHAPIMMSKYNRSSAPCFSGDGIVELVDGRTKFVKDVRKGDRLASSFDGTETPAVVRCVLVTRIKEEELDLVSLPSLQSDSNVNGGALKITPYHPVYSPAHKGWKFPVDLAPAKKQPCGVVYSFLLDRQEGCDKSDNHTVTINGIKCLTLGCGITSMSETDPRGHPFLGDYSKVVEELRTVDDVGFEMGRVESGGVRRESGSLKEELAVGFLRVHQEGEGDMWMPVKKQQQEHLVTSKCYI